MAKLDLNGDDEKVNIETIFWSAMDMLSDDDKKLPQASHSSSTKFCIKNRGCNFRVGCGLIGYFWGLRDLASSFVPS